MFHLITHINMARQYTATAAQFLLHLRTPVHYCDENKLHFLRCGHHSYIMMQD